MTKASLLNRYGQFECDVISHNSAYYTDLKEIHITKTLNMMQAIEIKSKLPYSMPNPDIFFTWSKIIEPYS